MKTEKTRLYSNCAWPRVSVTDYRYIDEDIQNAKVLMSTLGKSIFCGCTLTNMGMSSTDVDEFRLYSSTLSSAIFKMGQIKKAMFNKSTVVDCKISNMVIGPGRIGGTTLFKDCIFGKVTFFSILFDDVTFENCRFIGGSFSACSFDGTYSHFFPEKNTMNKFINCSMNETSFDGCSFNQRLSPVGIKMFELNNIPSTSVQFDNCRGSTILNNTVNRNGLDTKGFKGVITTSNKNTGIEAAVNSSEEDYYDKYPWGGLEDVSSITPVAKAQPVKKEYPTRYMSSGL